MQIDIASAIAAAASTGIVNRRPSNGRIVLIIGVYVCGDTRERRENFSKRGKNIERQ